MSGTKSKILDTARRLYNRYGVSVVSQRQIAEVLNISPGNLTYHFKKKEDIDAALYYQLVEEINAKMMVRQTQNPSVANLILLYGDIFDAFARYRFVFLDFVHFMKTHPQVADHYRQLQVLRQQQFTTVVTTLQDEGIVRPALLPNEYGFLYERMQVFADFFLSSREILPGDSPAKDKTDFVEGLRQMIFPYLTDLGRQGFEVL